MFPVVTKERQDLYEDILKEAKNLAEYIPEICGFHGRACRKMDKEANTMLCMGCSLKLFTATVDVILAVCHEKVAKNMGDFSEADVSEIQKRLKERVIDVDTTYIKTLLNCLGTNK